MINPFKRECKCSIFTKPEIVQGDAYDLKKEFNSFIGNQTNYVWDYTDFKYSCSGFCGLAWYIRDVKNGVTSSSSKKKFHQRACIKCGTCVSDYYKMIKVFNDKIKEIRNKVEKEYQEKKKIEKVKEICG